MDEELNKAIKTAQELAAVQNLLNERIKAGFKGKTIEKIKAELSGDSDSMLEYLIEISLPSEDFEICDAARQILSARTAKQ